MFTCHHVTKFLDISTLCKCQAPYMILRLCGVFFFWLKVSDMEEGGNGCIFQKWAGKFFPFRNFFLFAKTLNFGFKLTQFYFIFFGGGVKKRFKKSVNKRFPLMWKKHVSIIMNLHMDNSSTPCLYTTKYFICVVVKKKKKIRDQYFLPVIILPTSFTF